MQLLKMELRGFKSFADKTILTFDKGITAIVGPNGSGKSNISDAVRWVMGEQNVRQLRGLKSEDIIFAGTEKRRPQGVAEVSLYFDNTDHSLDVEFTEVVVTRRYFRSGDSEFYINKRPCRLKDIHMLFADTGIGQDSMAVIGQNRVDRILNSKPEERRIIFEEVAGISRYKNRKEEGLRKIAETERNLERIHDMMSVLEEQLGPMEEQAAKLKEFRSLDSERVAYEGTLTLQELRNSERLLTKAENSRSTAQERLDAATKELADAEAQRQKLMAVMEKEGETLRRLDAEALAAHNELDSMKNRSEAFSQRQVELKQEGLQIDEEETALQQKEESVKNQRILLAEQLTAKKGEFDAARNGLTLANDMFAQAEQDAAAKDTALQNVTSANSQREQEMFVLQRDQEELQRRIQDNESRAQDLQAQIAAKQEEEATLRKAADAMQQQCAEAKKTSDAADKAADMLVQERKIAAAILETSGKDILSLTSSNDGLSQRIRVLEGMEQEHEGAGRAAKEVLKASQSWRGDICGIIAELCKIPAQYTVAIDAALGGAAQHIIAANENAARSAIGYLKEKHAGRTTFLPLDTVKSRERTTDEEKAVQEKGIAGFANELIDYDKKYDAAFAFLLGRTLIAETQESGAAVARKYRHKLRIVCLDGTQFNPGGSLTGGSMRSREGSLISRKALLEELREQLAASKERLLQAQKKHHDAEDNLTAIDSQAASAEEARQQATLDLQKSSWQESTASRDLQQAQEMREQLAEQLAALQQDKTSLQSELQAKQKKSAAWDNKPVQETDQLEDEHQAALAELEKCRQAVTEQQIAVATLQEQVRHLEEQLEQNSVLKEQSDADKQRLAGRRTSLAARQQEAVDMLAQLAENIVTKEQEVKDKDTAKEEFYQSRADNFKNSQTMDETMKELRAQAEDWNRRINTADIQLEKYRGEIQRSEERLALQGLTRQEAMDRRREGSLKDLTGKVEELRGRIAELGQINPNADEDYRAAVERQTFLNKQCDDLIESRKKLEAVVAEIDEAMAEQFSKAFKEISGHFQRIFSRLFGGGKAEITLTNKSDILISGVDFVIQPPGKKEQQLNLLSGGERALTVIALLFAFLAYHPAPFCLVDEVDAALDEANVERFGRYLKNYSGNTQFIVITHRRKTMEAASTLQGVTMEEKGVSRLLTVKVDELLKEGT